MIACPTCGADTTVIETRDTGQYTRRRRACTKACTIRLTTVEMVIAATDKTAGGLLRPMLDMTLIRRRDLEKIFQLAGDALVARHGREDTIALLEPAPEPPPTGTPLPEGDAP